MDVTYKTNNNWVKLFITNVNYEFRKVRTIFAILRRKMEDFDKGMIRILCIFQAEKRAANTIALDWRNIFCHFHTIKSTENCIKV